MVMPAFLGMVLVAMLVSQARRWPSTHDTAACAGRHVRFEVLRGERTFKCLLTDMGSRNGTWLNRTRLQRCVRCPTVKHLHPLHLVTMQRCHATEPVGRLYPASPHAPRVSEVSDADIA